MERPVQMRTKPRHPKRPGLDTADTTSGSLKRVDRASSHNAPSNGVHTIDASTNRRSKGASIDNVDTIDHRLEANKGAPPEGYRKRDGTNRRSRGDEGRSIELNEMKTNGDVTTTSNDVTMRRQPRDSTAKCVSYREAGYDVSYRKSGYNVWTEPGGKLRAHIKFTRDLQNKGGKKWDELRHVTQLTIDDEDHVFKSMPGQLCELTDLKALRFTLSGATSVPARLGALRLRHLSLHENHLANVDVLTKMTSLVTLDISFNELHTLPAQIGALNKLQVLNVSNNKITALPPSIGQLHDLRELSASANKLTMLPDSIGSMRHLNLLDVGANHLSSLPETIGKLNDVIELRASHNQLKTLPASIGDMRSLQFLFLASNSFVEVPPILEKIGTLRVINMNRNRVADMTCPMRGVRSLTLDENQLVTFPEAILACVSLEILSLQANRICDIPDDIRRLRNLHSLYLDSNELSEVPESISHLVNLNHLALRGTNVQRLPKSFKALDRLTVLTMNEDKLEKALRDAYMEGIPGVMRYVNSTQM